MHKNRYWRLFHAMALFLSAATIRAEDGITNDSIVLGQSAGFTGTAANEVKQATAGAKLYFDMINQKGGVHGRRIILESMDDGFEPKRTVENTEYLIRQKKAFALFLYRGTPTTEAVLPLIAAAKVPLIAPVTGATSLHEPMHRYLFNVRARYRDEVENAVDQLAGMGMLRVAALVSNDSFGKDVLEGLKQSLSARKMPDPFIAFYERNTVAVEEAVKKIHSSSPQAVLLICTAKPCDAFIRQYRDAGGYQQLFALSNVSSPAFTKGLGDYARGIGMTQVFPSPRSTALPITKEFNKAVEANAELASSHPALEGFIAAKIMVEGLRKAGKNPTREGLVQALEDLNRFDIGGLTLHYGPASRTGLKFVELTVIGKSGMVLR